MGSRRSLIVVDRWAFQNLPAVSLIPISDDRAFLAFEKEKDSGVLELELIDRLEQPAVNRDEHAALKSCAPVFVSGGMIRQLKFLFKSILILERDSRRSPSSTVTSSLLASSWFARSDKNQPPGRKDTKKGQESFRKSREVPTGR